MELSEVAGENELNPAKRRLTVAFASKDSYCKIQPVDDGSIKLLRS